MAEVNESIVPQKTDEPYWYVVHTYSGYEKKVKANIEKTIENRHLENEILEVQVPVKEVVEIKDGKKRKLQKKLFPGYVLIKMIMNEVTWYIVRNTRGVTGFVGPGSKAVPLEDYEIDSTKSSFDKKLSSVDFEEGDTIIVTSGVWQDTTGVVQSINLNKQTVTINVMIFDRETPVDISILDVKKV